MTAASSPAAAPTVAPITRREFLYYIWGASMALALAQSGGALVWFAIPRFPPGTFGGDFTLDISEVPPTDSEPKSFDAGRFWLVNIGDKQMAQMSEYETLAEDNPTLQKKGVRALYKICVHLGCLYKWLPTNNRFECPCHGSKYLPTGARVEGPASRNLDVFVIEALDAQGTVVTSTQKPANGPEGLAIDLSQFSNVVKLRVKTGTKINGGPNSVTHNRKAA